MKIKIISFIIAAAALLSAFFYTRSDIASSDEIKQWIDKGALIVDVRTPEEFAAARFEGAVNIPLSELEKNLQIFGDKDMKIIVYCRTGNRSGQAKKILIKNGFENVINGGGLSDMNK
ncbi:MAG TPA: rhodanese-like domain-containing protein [Spirochaetota bacterium]|nr:rhodanese-like domain-containing protein [Spirochaetota bacterium]HPF07100.1 rhodanese-like domain-containing protein [Spirochaetota bacterium]HPJ43371.1 rhodanese-like domain-containing protein [Spirochaetota bacterium]HPR37523.1 rhodanese-like domain-containing protein [Spirochaetota bacterium]